VVHSSGGDCLKVEDELSDLFGDSTTSALMHGAIFNPDTLVGSGMGKFTCAPFSCNELEVHQCIQPCISYQCLRRII
jgi:hypothetical protein